VGVATRTRPVGQLGVHTFAVHDQRGRASQCAVL
jgi:hypothetical protein